MNLRIFYLMRHRTNYLIRRWAGGLTGQTHFSLTENKFYLAVLQKFLNTMELQANIFTLSHVK